MKDTGEAFVGGAVFPPLDRMGDAAVHLASIKPEGSPPAMKILLHLVVCIARQRIRIRIRNRYFLPDSDAIGALCEAAKRGIDARVRVPSTCMSASRRLMPSFFGCANSAFVPQSRNGIPAFGQDPSFGDAPQFAGLQSFAPLPKGTDATSVLRRIPGRPHLEARAR